METVAFIVVAVVCTILALGHVWWGFVHPFKALRNTQNDPVVIASLHACWYHISILFVVTAGLIIWHLTIAPVTPDVLTLLWGLIFAFWLAYWGVLFFHPALWRIAWGQMALIAIVLLNLGYGIYTLHI